MVKGVRRTSGSARRLVVRLLPQIERIDMSLCLNVSKIAAVFIGNTWHNVAIGTFDVDAYEFMHPDWFTPHGKERENRLYGGTSADGNSSTGFRFQDAEDGSWISGPMSSLLAIREIHDA